MARPPTGSVVERRGARGTTYALRFRALGKRQYVTLGSNVTTRPQAEEELQAVLADVRRGLWRPPVKSVVETPKAEPTFHEFASEWVAAREAEGLAAKTMTDLRWSLSNHVLGFFADFRLSEIGPREVDAFATAKARERLEIEKRREAAIAKGERFTERGLSNASINHVLKVLAQVLEAAVEYGLIASNPAAGKRRRLKAERPARPWVEPEQLMALLDAAEGTGKLLLSILAGAGLRIGEALNLKWENVDLGTGTLHVVASKTDAGVREVHLTPALREQLTLARADRDPKPTDYVIATSTGHKHNPSNLRRDVLAPAVEAANVKLAKAGISPIGHLTFHGLRRTFASIRAASGDDVRYVADQLGHTDVRFSLGVYAKALRRRERLTGAHRKAYDRAIEWARMGTNDDLTVPELQVQATENPA